MTDMQVLLITGTSAGIGRSLAEHFTHRNWRVYGCSRSPLTVESENYRHFPLDVTDEAAVKNLFGTIQNETGRLDVMINNAGVASMNHCLLTPMTTVEKVLSTNVAGTFLFSREAAKLMQRSRTGRIINLSSVAVPLKLEGEAVYAASKAAVETLTAVLARELGSLGITVNAIGPGPIDTNLTRHITGEKMNNLLKRQAIPQRCEFSDVINVVEFLIRPESRMVTGQIIYLGGV